MFNERRVPQYLEHPCEPQKGTDLIGLSFPSRAPGRRLTRVSVGRTPSPSLPSRLAACEAMLGDQKEAQDSVSQAL